MKVESVDIMVQLGNDPKYDKVKPVIGQALKMMAKVPDFDQRIRAKNGYSLF